jgi:hypothetical protein
MCSKGDEADIPNVIKRNPLTARYSGLPKLGCNE